jgi:DNA-binding HxlR family transcriptional regulator
VQLLDLGGTGSGLPHLPAACNDALVPDYGRFCPVALTTEVLADRWTPMIVRELVLGNTRFNDIARGLPGISRSLLTQRLRHLEKRGCIERWPSSAGKGYEYRLTPAGRDLERVIDAFGRWAIEWLFDDLYPQEVDPPTLMWWMHRRTDPSEFPDQRVVLEYVFTAPDPMSIWLVLEHGEVSVCHQHPGFEVDVHLRGTTAEFSYLFNGRTSWREAVRDGRIEVAGPSRLVRELPSWFLWSPWHEVTRERMARA